MHRRRNSVADEAAEPVLGWLLRLLLPFLFRAAAQLCLDEVLRGQMLGEYSMWSDRSQFQIGKLDSHWTLY